MPNPTRKWDQIPVFAWYYQRPGVPSTGTVTFTVNERVRGTDGRKEIYPAGAQRTVAIGKTEDQDPAARAEVHDAMKIQAEAVALAAGEAWDPIAWEMEWDAALEAAIFTYFYLSDDPNVTPNGWQPKVDERIAGQQVKPYYIETLSAYLLNEVPGVNLGDYELPPGSAVAPAPIYAKGQPGGIAALDADGDVVDADGVKVTGGGVSSWDDLTDKPTTFPPATHGHTVGQVSGLATVATSGSYDDLINKPTIPAAPSAASTTTAGVVELATTAETTTGTDATRAVTPAGLKVELDKKAGTTAATTAAAGIVELATTAETTTGTDTARAVTPAGVTAALAGRLQMVAVGGVTLSGRWLVGPDEATIDAATKQPGDILSWTGPSA